MGDKVLIFNIALNALLITYQTTDPDTDIRKEAVKLRMVYPLALSKVLADLDLNRTAKKVKLELRAGLTDPNWAYVYKYPADCAKFRRIVSPFPVDNRETRIPFQTQVVDEPNGVGVSSILTNALDAWGEIIPSDVPLSNLNPNAIICVGLQTAILATALIAGKGSKEVKAAIAQDYNFTKAEAMEDDQNENIDTTPDEFKSEFAQARLGRNRFNRRGY